MKQNNRMIRSIERGKKDKETLLVFLQENSKEAAALASAMFALNLPAYLETYQEDEKEHKIHPMIKKATDALLETAVLIKDAVCNNLSIEESLSYAVISQRDANIHQMQLLSAYADRFTVFEYVLNRLEHRFSGKKLENGYSDEEAADKIMRGIAKISDRSSQQSTIVQVVEQLPMRMTRKRFFQIVGEGFDVYTGSEKKTVEDLIYMIRTAALLEKPEGMTNDYAKLFALSEELMTADYSHLEEAGYKELWEKTVIGMKELNAQMDQIMMLQDLLNELAVLIYTNGMPKNPDFYTCMQLVDHVLTSYKENGFVSEDVYEGYEALEGLQEEAAGRFFELSAAAAEFAQAYEKDIKEEQLEKEFVTAERLNRLLSSSRFASLEMSEDEAELATEDWIQEVYSAVCSDVTAQLKAMPKLVSRAVMAKILTLFPLFVREYNELEAYVRSSLEACTDEAEKIACLEILDAVLEI